MDKRKKFKIKSLQQAVFLCFIRNTEGGHDGVARILGMSRQTSLNFLYDGVTWKCVYKLADHYGVSPYLIDYRVSTLVAGPNKETLFDLAKKCKKFTEDQHKVLRTVAKRYGDISAEDFEVF